MGDMWEMSLGEELRLGECGRGGQSALTTRLRAFHFTLKSQAESSFVCFEVHEIFWGGFSIEEKNPKIMKMNLLGSLPGPVPVTGREDEPSLALLCPGVPWMFQRWGGGGGFSGCHACLELSGLGLDADTIFGAPESDELGCLRGALGISSAQREWL